MVLDDYDCNRRSGCADPTLAWSTTDPTHPSTGGHSGLYRQVARLGVASIIACKGGQENPCGGCRISANVNILALLIISNR